MRGQHLYIMQMAKTGAFKIGRSNNPHKRLGQLQTGCPYTIRLILVLPNQGHREKEIHKGMMAYKTRVYRGEWFREEGWGSLPEWVYEQIPLDVLEAVNLEWWKD